MKYLKYFTGNPEQKFNFYELTEKEAKEMGEFLTSVNRSSHFEFRGNILIAARAEIVSQEEDFYSRKAQEFKKKYEI